MYFVNIERLLAEVKCNGFMQTYPQELVNRPFIIY